MAGATLRVRGLRETERALRKCEGGLGKMLREELKKAADIVAKDASPRLARLQPVSAAGIKGKLKGGSTAVAQQTLRRTTGKRGDWGATQMRVALEPALVAKEGEVVRHVEGAIDHLAGSAGF